MLLGGSLQAGGGCGPGSVGDALGAPGTGAGDTGSWRSGVSRHLKAVSKLVKSLQQQQRLSNSCNAMQPVIPLLGSQAAPR